MVAGNLAEISTILGVSLSMLVTIIIWSAVWKGIALWKPQKFLISDGYQKSKDF